MAHIVYRRDIDQYLILGRGATTHLETAGCIALALNSSEQLHGAHDILFAKQLWRCGKVFDLHLFGSCLYLAKALAG